MGNKKTPNIEDGRDWKITKTPSGRFTAYLMDTLVGEEYATWDEAVEAIEGVAEEMGMRGAKTFESIFSGSDTSTGKADFPLGVV